MAAPDAHAEGDGEDLGPKCRDADIDLAPGCEAQSLDDGDEGRSSNGERRQQDVPADHPGELDAR